MFISFSAKIVKFLVKKLLYKIYNLLRGTENISLASYLDFSNFDKFLFLKKNF